MIATYKHLQGQLEATKKRIAELEAEKAALRPIGVMSERAFLYGQDREFIYRVSVLMTALLFTPE